jgi:hypothetical protein
MEYQINNCIIDKIYRNKEDKSGKPYTSAKGDSFVKVDIYIDPREIDHSEFKGKMTYFDYFDVSGNWGVGTPLTGTVTTNEFNGVTYFNYSPPPSGKKALELDLKELEERIKKLEDKVFGLKGHSQEVDIALDMSREMLEEEEIVDDDLPF